VADVREAFEFARAGCGNDHLLASGKLSSYLGHEGSHIPMIAGGLLRLQNETAAALIRHSQLLNAQTGEKLERERPLVFTEDVANRRRREGVLGLLESLIELSTVRRDGLVELRRFIQ